MNRFPFKAVCINPFTTGRTLPVKGDEVIVTAESIGDDGIKYYALQYQGHSVKWRADRFKPLTFNQYYEQLERYIGS